MEGKLVKWLPKKNQWIILLLIGILLIVIAIPTKDGTKQESLFQVQDTDTSSTEIEKRLENMLSQMKGVGDVHVMITYQEKEVEGIVVVAEGGGNSVVIRNITEVVQALFDVNSHKIRVIEQK